MQSAAALDNGGEMLSIGKLGEGQERYYLVVADGARIATLGGEPASGSAPPPACLDGEVGENHLVATLPPATGRMAN